MRAVSDQFLETVVGSHRMLARARVLTVIPQFGLQPTGTEIPILSGDVKLSSSAKIKATLEMETSGEYWDLVQPYGNEIFVERGIDYGDGTREWVGLGYFRIEEVHQDDAPKGPIRISAKDRTAQLIQNRPLYPISFNTSTNLNAAFERLVNGVGGGYGMYFLNPVPINWPSNLNPLARFVTGTSVEDSSYDYLEGRLSEIPAANGGPFTMRFGADGELYIISQQATGDPVYTIRRGETGTLIRASRGVSREGVYNVVSAYGSDPAYPTGYHVAFNTDVNSPIRWNGHFGVAPRYYASPLLRTTAQAQAAARTVLSQYTGLPYSLSLFAVPNPALEPFDVIEVRYGGSPETHVIDEVTIPLTAEDEIQITTRTINTVVEDE